MEGGQPHQREHAAETEVQIAEIKTKIVFIKKMIIIKILGTHSLSGRGVQNFLLFLNKKNVFNEFLKILLFHFLNLKKIFNSDVVFFRKNDKCCIHLSSYTFFLTGKGPHLQF
jgi:hypothetical protein